MGINFQPLGPDTKNRYSKLPQEVQKQGETIADLAGTKVGGRTGLESGEEVGAWDADGRAPARDSFGDWFSGVVTGEGGEEGVDHLMNRRNPAEPITVPTTVGNNVDVEGQ